MTVPDEPVDLPPNQALIAHIEAKNVDESPVRESALAWLGANASDSTEMPSDLTHQHDHYLYGVPKGARLNAAARLFRGHFFPDCPSHKSDQNHTRIPL